VLEIDETLQEKRHKFWQYLLVWHSRLWTASPFKPARWLDWVKWPRNRVLWQRLIQGSFADCEAMLLVGDGKRQRIRIEFEYERRNVLKHMHDAKECDLIVFWKPQLAGVSDRGFGVEQASDKKSCGRLRK
jgi:hypothetical protein